MENNLINKLKLQNIDLQKENLHLHKIILDLKEKNIKAEINVDFFKNQLKTETEQRKKRLEKFREELK